MLREIKCQSLQGVERLKQFSKADVSVVFVNNLLSLQKQNFKRLMMEILSFCSDE